MVKNVKDYFQFFIPFQTSVTATRPRLVIAGTATSAWNTWRPTSRRKTSNSWRSSGKFWTQLQRKTLQDRGKWSVGQQNNRWKINSNSVFVLKRTNQVIFVMCSIAFIFFKHIIFILTAAIDSPMKNLFPGWQKIIIFTKKIIPSKKTIALWYHKSSYALKLTIYILVASFCLHP